jgi:hypothetical protein
MVRPAAMKTAARREPPVKSAEALEAKPLGVTDACVALPDEPGMVGEE